MPIQTVTEITQSIKLILENGFSFITVIGEISNLRKPYSGHLYFSLKDEKSQIRAVLFKMQQRYLAKDLKNGMSVMCHGRISVYEQRGEYQLIIDSVEDRGEGALQIAFEKLKQKLADEGLFDKQHKKPLPFLPGKIAIVTSPRGAAIQDFLKIAEDVCPSVPIDIYPSSVQGDRAVKEICASLQLINDTKDADVIVICRGGGSIEDLWTFNDESLARAIFNSAIPIVSAIGHEIDFTIADFTADFRATTPSAAAETVLPNSSVLKEKISMHQEQMTHSLGANISLLGNKVSSLKRILGSPIELINHNQMKTDYAVTRCMNALSMVIQRKKHHFLKKEDRFFILNPQIQLKTKRELTQAGSNRLINAIDNVLEEKRLSLYIQNTIFRAVSPWSVLDRGYAIIQAPNKKSVIRSKKQVAEGDILTVHLADGTIRTKVLPDRQKPE